MTHVCPQEGCFDCYSEAMNAPIDAALQAMHDLCVWALCSGNAHCSVVTPTEFKTVWEVKCR